MHGRHKLARRRPVEPLPPPASLARIFDELDREDRRRRRERPLNDSFSALRMTQDGASQPFVIDEGTTAVVRMRYNGPSNSWSLDGLLDQF